MRTRALLLLGLLVTAGALLTLWPAAPGAAISERSFERICLGMPKADVEALLGGPAEDYGTGTIVRMGRLDAGPPGYGDWLWIGNTRAISITFDAQDQVVWKAYGLVDREPIPRIPLRRWFGF